jgi:hypothetical protein
MRKEFNIGDIVKFDRIHCSDPNSIGLILNKEIPKEIRNMVDYEKNEQWYKDKHTVYEIYWTGIGKIIKWDYRHNMLINLSDQ